MIKKKPIIDDLAEEVMKELAKLDRGDVIFLEKIEQLTGMVRYEGHWTSVKSRVYRRMLDERGIELWPERGVGFKLSTLEDQMNRNVVKRMRRSRRQASMSKKSLESLPPSELGILGQQMRAVRLQLVTELRKQAGSKTRTISKLSKRSEGLPR